jgi:hypothetical protein
VDGDSTDNPQVTAGVLNEHLHSPAEKSLPQDNNTDNNGNAGISDIKAKHSSTNNSDPSYYLAHALTTPLNLRIHVDMMKYPLHYLKSALLISHQF